MTTPIPDKSPDKISPGKPLEPTSPQVTPGKGAPSFDTYMQGQGKTAPTGTPGAPGSPNPMEMAQGPAFQTAGVSFNSLLAQAQGAQDSLGTVGKQLSDQNLKLKRSQSHLVRQKLGDADSHIRAAGAKLGIDAPPMKMPAGATGVARFLAMINDGQDQLAGIQKQLNDLAAKGEQINPGDMMAIQVKMGLAQQEIEYTTTLLGKVIQSVTQIINTQL